MYNVSPSRSVALIDTPAFDSTTRSELEVLRSIISFCSAYSQILRVTSIVYLHRISGKRVTATSKLNLRVVQAMAGAHFYQNMVLVTSMWDEAPRSMIPELETREAELNGSSSAFWANMLEMGARYARYEGHANSARTIIDLCLQTRSEPPRMAIELERARKIELEDTAAGLVLGEEEKRREEKMKAELLEDQEAEKETLRQAKAHAEAQLREAEEQLMREAVDHREHQHREPQGWSSWMPRPARPPARADRHGRDDVPQSAYHLGDERRRRPDQEVLGWIRKKSSGRH
jgi:hypothetical protein